MPKATRNPRTLSSKTRFSGRVFHVDRDRVRLPNGRTATLDIVRHRGSVVLIPQPSASEVVLVRQYRYAIDRWVWELPAGTLDPGERPVAAARRECAEEIGWWPRRLTKLGAFYPSPGILDELMTYYRCTELIRPPKPAAQDPDEQIQPRSFPLRRVRDLIARGDIVDMKTVVGLSLLGR
jgi:ADP-ribose pyrophosphatase